jgi:hypothetical protein
VPQARVAPMPDAGGRAGDLAAVPCAQTLLRWNLLRLAKLVDSGSPLRSVPAVLRPLVWMRSGGVIQSIERALDAEEVISLAPEAVGAAEQAWHARLRQFGPPIVPLLAQALVKCEVLHGERRNVFVERLVSAFYWFGDAGAAALLACFDCLDDYGKSLSCVVLGLFQHKPAAGRLWDFLNHALPAAGEVPERLYVGSLWALIDLGDARAADAVASLLETGDWFYELPDFVALAGDLRCVEPVLLALALASSQEERQSLMMALACILLRSGEAPIIAKVRKTVDVEDEASAERFVGDLSEKLLPQCESYLRVLRLG